jgi:mannose-6-phosphate isomerase
LKLQPAQTAGVVRYAPGDSEKRPWGSWEVLATGPGYAVKRLVVNPGQRLSLQYHHHRSEHWTIVAGEAEAELDGEIHRLSADGRVHIPATVTHRIRNIGAEALVFVEIQVGALLDENDIVRLADDYGRPS